MGTAAIPGSCTTTYPSPATPRRATAGAIALAETVQARPGPPLGSEGQRRRPVGRIGGGLGLPPSGALEGLAHALGPDARVLAADACPAGETALVCDWDSCWLDGAPVRDLPAWQRPLAA